MVIEVVGASARGMRFGHLPKPPANPNVAAPFEASKTPLRWIVTRTVVLASVPVKPPC
jgi:hypothetical protein